MPGTHHALTDSAVSATTSYLATLTADDTDTPEVAAELSLPNLNAHVKADTNVQVTYMDM